MKKIPLFILCFAFLLISHSVLANFTVNLYVDSAPNVYGSPNWGTWWNKTKEDVVGGTFKNMRTGTYPGTFYYDPYDMIVYSTDDLGKRIHWIYWIPGKSVSSLGGLFQVKWVVDWGGNHWTYDWLSSQPNWILDGDEVGWVQPGRWEDYSNGVIGSFGFAWWATDDDAPPHSTDTYPYNETDQDDIDALRRLVFQHQTYLNGIVRYRESIDSNWEYKNIKLTPVPEPGTLLMVGSGIACVAGYARIKFGRRNRKQQ